ncbi:MAG: SpoIIE family protein phosphatase [Tepidisphaeraceae bacterium]
MKLSTRVLLLVLGVALTTSALVIWVINVNLTRHETARANAAISSAIQRYLSRVSDRHEQIKQLLQTTLEDQQTRSYFQGADEGDEKSIRRLRDEVFEGDVKRQMADDLHLRAAFHVLVDLTARPLFIKAPNEPELEKYLAGGAVKWSFDADSAELVRRHVVTPQGLFLLLGVPLKAQLSELPTHAYFVGLRVDDAWLRNELFIEGQGRGPIPLVACFMVGDRIVASGSSGDDAIMPEGFDRAVTKIQVAPTSAASAELSLPDPVEFDVAGEAFLGQAFTLGGTSNPPGRLLIASSLDVALESLRYLRKQIVFITLAAALLAVLGARAVSRMLSKPVEQMVAATQRISTGHFDEPVNVQRNDELGTLAGALNEMTQGLKERQRLREEKVKRDHDLDVARRIQMGVLPQALPDVKGYDFSSYAHPAEQTGGDIFDVVALDEDVTPAGPAVAILLADATGHGIGPAISVTQVRAMLRMGVRLGGSLRNVLDQMNRQLCADLGAGRFVTAFLGRLDPAAHRIDYDAAGQAPLLHYHAKEKRAEWRNASMIPLGVADDPMEDRIETMELEEGDVVALLTDGFYEYIGPGDEQFQSERVSELVVQHHCRPAKEILDAILSAVRDFAKGCPQLDDMTAIVIKRSVAPTSS